MTLPLPPNRYYKVRTFYNIYMELWRQYSTRASGVVALCHSILFLLWRHWFVQNRSCKSAGVLWLLGGGERRLEAAGHKPAPKPPFMFLRNTCLFALRHLQLQCFWNKPKIPESVAMPAAISRPRCQCSTWGKQTSIGVDLVSTNYNKNEPKK